MPKKINLPKNITEENFQEEVLDGQGLVLVQFRTEWNGACQIIAPVYDSLSRSYAGIARFYSVDAEADQDLASRYRVMECPTILFFRGGSLVDSSVGLQPKNLLISKIEQALANAGE